MQPGQGAPVDDQVLTAATVEYRMARSALVTAIASTCPAWPVASRPAAGAGGHVPDTRTVEVV
jgi:hypothetical protein